MLPTLAHNIAQQKQCHANINNILNTHLSKQLDTQLQDLLEHYIYILTVLSKTGVQTMQHLDDLATCIAVLEERVTEINSFAQHLHTLAINTAIATAHHSTANNGLPIITAEIKQIAEQAANLGKSVIQKTTKIKSHAELATNITHSITAMDLNTAIINQKNIASLIAKFQQFEQKLSQKLPSYGDNLQKISENIAELNKMVKSNL